MSFAAPLRWVRRSSIWTSRAVGWGLLGVALACAAVVLTLRYWFLPNIETYREDIAAAVSRAANLRITIAKISGDWDGMRPYLKLEGVSVYDKSGRRALDLERVDSTLSWRSVPALRLHFHALDIFKPSLEVRRDAKGVMSVAGIELELAGNGGFTDWLLEQRSVNVHDAVVSWSDELRQAPRLELSGVTFQLANRGRRHRFGLRALPPAKLAGPIDLRGDVRGDTVQVLSDWNGKLYLQLDHVDLAAWKAWIDIPVDITRGAGALRSWLTFSQHELAEAIADVRLTQVRSRLRKDLPELELESLTGRLAWKHLPDGFEFSTAKLSLTSGGASLPPADLSVRVTNDKQGGQLGELHANALSLAPLVMLADRLPIDQELRTEAVALSPRGNLHDVSVKWKGAWPNPETYSARGRFEGLAFNRWHKLPGVSGLSGTLDGTEKGGTFNVNAQRTELDLPQVFAAPLGLDTFAAQVAWTRSPERVELRLNNVAFANPDAAGTLSGSYRSARQGPGEVDLTGALSRADARSVTRYIPITIMKTARPWLERALVAGQSKDVRFRMKGRLEDFPFRDEKRGLFQITAKVTGGTLDYAERWPRIENIEGDLEFRGTRMEFAARQGTINGVKLGKVQGEIPDLKVRPEVLTVNGEAEGATPDFLAFIAATPVAGMIDHFTDGIQAQGTGRLALKLVLPLGQLQSTKVTGSYQFINNQIVFERDLPPLEQANGRIEFTESSVRAPAVNAVFLGGPITIAAATQRDSPARVTMQGRINAESVRKAGGPAWMQHLRGTTDWRGALTLRKKMPDIVIESNLQGISSSLPAPFSKTANDAVPMRLERRFTGAQQDRVSLVYGDLVKAELARRTDGKQTIIERGVVRLGGGETGEPDRPGVWIRGALKTFDLDDWLAFSRSGEGDTTFTVAGADVKLGHVDFFGRNFHDLALTVAPLGGATHLTLAAREIEGTATWRGDGKGRLVARLKKLTWPAAETKAPSAPKPPGSKSPDLPTLDIVVEQFQLGQKQLGRLELNAAHQDRDWRIEKLRVASAESVITADGVWQGWQTQPRTQINVRMEVTDIGATLARYGYPPGVRRGTAKIEGNLAWAGGPYDFDYPTMSGNLKIEAAKGQFVKLEPGFGKLLGILSLQALPRRITLDFRDVFSEGFAFDSIAATVKIDRGIATTDNFRIQGPAARVLMTGDVDLVRETQKLRVRVTPHLSDSVSIASTILGGPIAGAAVFVAQKLLKDPIEQFVSFDYNVAGSWSDPQVAKVERVAMPATPEGGGP